MQNFAITNVKTNLFWSNLDGWVSDGFDLFTLDESEYLRLPIDGKWVNLSKMVTKRYKVSASYLTHVYTFVEAKDEEQAWDIAGDIDGGDFEIDNIYDDLSDWSINMVEEVKA